MPKLKIIECFVTVDGSFTWIVGWSNLRSKVGIFCMGASVYKNKSNLKCEITLFINYILF